MTKIHMDPAATVIAKAGGPKAVSRITGDDYSRVCRWRYQDGGGTGGVVPHDSAMKLLFWARNHARRAHKRPVLTSADFMKLPTRST